MQAGDQDSPKAIDVADSPASRSVHTLFPALYGQLRRLARSRLAASGHQTLLDTSVLIHEAYLRMQRDGGVALQDQQHFLAYAASTMRSIVVDSVRRRAAQRRGNAAEHLTLGAVDAERSTASDDEVLDVHDALERLRDIDARLVQVVEMRYFGGLSDGEIASALGVTDRTVRRDWERARLLLAEMLGR